MINLSASDQKKLDAVLLSSCTNLETKAPLGINTVVSVSLACAQAGAYFCNRPLYRHIACSRLGEEPRSFKPVRVVMNMLHTGKRFNTKNKFRKFGLYETTPLKFQAVVGSGERRGSRAQAAR